MKTETQKLGDKLGEKLRRGNGGSFESDIQAIRSVASDYIERESWTGETIAEIATQFAAWVLYRFHNASNPAKSDVGSGGVVITDKFERVDIWLQPDSAGNVLLHGDDFFPRVIGAADVLVVDGRTIRFDLTKLNYRKRDSAELFHSVFLETVADVANAFNNPGRAPAVHNKAILDLRRDWRTLYNAVSTVARQWNHWKAGVLEPINNDVDAGPIGPTDDDARETAIRVNQDAVWNDAIAEAFPLLKDLGRYEVSDPFEAVGLLRLMMNGQDLSESGTDAFDDWVANIRKTILKRHLSQDKFAAEYGDAGFCPENIEADDSIQNEIINRMNESLAAADRKFPGDRLPFPSDVVSRMKADRHAAELEAGKRCMNCGDRNNKFPYPGGLRYMDKDGVFCSEKCGVEYPFPEASNVEFGVTAGGTGELLGTHSIKPAAELEREKLEADRKQRGLTEAGGSYFSEPGYSPDLRQCDNCKMWFSGPAKLDAKFTFCGGDCQSHFYKKANFGNEPAVILNPPAIVDEPNPVKCEHCGRIFPGPDTFVIALPHSAHPRTLCSVNCVAAFLGVK